MDLKIFPPEEMVETQIELPVSKSMLNRALIMNALAPHPGDMGDVDVCDDTRVMAQALTSVHGDVNVGGAGTAMRFLTAYYAATPGTDITLDGSERMLQRPIGALVTILRECGAEIEYAGEQGYPPLRIRGQRLHGGKMSIDASISSQFISALLMVAPTFISPVELKLEGEVASWPYLNMTVQMMRHRGIDCYMERDGMELTGMQPSLLANADGIHVSPGTYQAVGRQDVERDWSAASYWYSIAALSAGWVTLPGLRVPSLQGDSRLAQIYEKLGVVTEVTDEGVELSASPEVYSRLDEDLADAPDIVQTLVVTCCMVGTPFTFTGVSSLRIKETDRLAALCKEADRLGCTLEVVGDDTIKWDGKRHPIFAEPVIETYDDHRMAMAFAPVALYLPGLVIADSEVVSKSYPGYWHDLEHAGFTIEKL